MSDCLSKYKDQITFLIDKRLKTKLVPVHSGIRHDLYTHMCLEETIKNLKSANVFGFSHGPICVCIEV